MFRHERPQKGRLRQFHQIGAELILDGSPEADVETIVLLDTIFKSFGLREYEIRINSVGSEESRPAYKELLKNFLRPQLSLLCEQCLKRFDRAPMRILDCKNESCQQVVEKAPRMVDHLDTASKLHHEKVKALLEKAGVEFTEDPNIVRGLDYYSRTAFEFTSPLLGAQSALGGGGRYDGLPARFGADPFPAVGWALGMERLLLALDAIGWVTPPTPKPDFFFAPLGEAAFEKLLSLSWEMKREGVAVEIPYERDKKLKWLMKQADRVGARFTLLLGDDDLKSGQVPLKNMATGEQQTISLQDLKSELKRRAENAA
jgi:histidyl-tRNA synthetase